MHVLGVYKPQPVKKLYEGCLSFNSNCDTMRMDLCGEKHITTWLPVILLAEADPFYALGSPWQVSYGPIIRKQYWNEA